MCLFSIIIPCYNIEEDLPNAVESVLSQTCSNYEVILVNDGSTDNTFEIMQSYAGYKNFKIVDNSPNKGLAATRNAGLKHIEGKFVLFFDGDDTYQPDLLKDIEEFLFANPDMDMISFGYGRYKNNELIKSFSHPEFNKRIFDSHTFLTLFLKRQLKQHICAFALRVAVMEKYNLSFDEATPVGEDQEFQIKADFHSEKIGYLSKIYFKYNVRDTSLIGAPFNKKRLTTLNVFERLYEYLTERNADSTIIKNLINYSSIEYFSVLNKCIKQGTYEFINDIKKKDSVVHHNAGIGFDRYAVIATFLRTAYRINSKLFVSILKVI